MARMSAVGETVQPYAHAANGDEPNGDVAGGQVRSLHERKYRVFRRMADDQIAYRRIMHGHAP